MDKNIERSLAAARSTEAHRIDLFTRVKNNRERDLRRASFVRKMFSGSMKADIDEVTAKLSGARNKYEFLNTIVDFDFTPEGGWTLKGNFRGNPFTLDRLTEAQKRSQRKLVDYVVSLNGRVIDDNGPIVRTYVPIVNDLLQRAGLGGRTQQDRTGGQGRARGQSRTNDRAGGQEWTGWEGRTGGQGNDGQRSRTGGQAGGRTGSSGSESNRRREGRVDPRDHLGYFATLGLNPDELSGLTDAQISKKIRDKFRPLAHKYHADLNPNDKNAEEMMKKVNVANDTLSKPDKRKEYMTRTGEFEPNGRDH